MRTVLTALIGSALLWLPACDRQPSAPTGAGTQQQQQEDIAAAYNAAADPPQTGTGPAADDAQAVESARLQVQAEFDRMATLMANSDYEAAADIFDIDRMLDEVAAHGVSTGNFSQRRQLAQGMRIGMTQAIQRGEVFTTDAREVRRLRLIPDSNEAVVYTRVTDAAGIIIKTRWWFTHDNGTWRVYDFEDLDVSIRMSVLMAAMLDTVTRGSLAPWVAELQNLMQVVAMIEAEQWQQTQAYLQGLKLDGAPRDVRALRSMLLVSTSLGQENYEQAERYLIETENLNPDMPILLYQRAAIHMGYGQYEQALEHIDAYIDRLGADADIYFFQMISLDNLDRHDDAVRAGENMVADNPVGDTIAEFGLILNEDEKPRIAELIIEHKLDPSHFELIGETFYLNDDWEALRSAVQGFTSIDPDGLDTAYYDTLVMISDGKNEEAAQRVGRVLNRITDPQIREPYQVLYLQAMRYAGKALEAYDQADDPDGAFNTLASQMYWDEENEALTELARKHIAQRPDDPQGYYYLGILAAYQEDYADADGHFADALARARDEETKADVRYEWASALCRAGRWAEVPQRVGSDGQTLDQVMWHLINAEDAPALESFLNTHNNDAPNLGFAHLFILQNTHGKAAEYLLSHRDALRSDETIYNYDNLLIRSLTRAGQYDEAIKHAKASTDYDGDPYYELVVYIASGDVDNAIAAAQGCMDTGYYAVDEFYYDDLIAEHVNSPAMQAFRDKFPPQDQDTTEQSTNDSVQ